MKKWLLNSTKTLILVIIIFAIYIGINILLENVILPELDLTSEKIYSISDETKEKVQNIEKEVKIQFINFGSYEDIINFAEKYKALNKNIEIERIDDLASRTDLMQKYSLEATDSLIIVSSGELEKTLQIYDLYTYDYSTYEKIDTTEEAITNAIVNVVTEDKPNIYFMTNHIAYDVEYYSTILSSLENEANEVNTLDIFSNGGIPENCDTLVITTLKEDITELERDKILEYIENGGNLLLMCGPNFKKVDLSNFQKILDQYGITISQGVMFEQSTANMLSSYPDIIISEVQSTAINDKLNMSLKLCLVDTAKITFNEEKLQELGVNYETIATTTDSAYERTDLTSNSISKTSNDGENETAIVAASITKTIDEEQNKISKLVVYGNEMLAMDMPIPIGEYTYNTVLLYNNKDMVLNSIAYLNERDDTIVIRKNYDSDIYTVTQQQHNIILAIIFAIPVIIIILGIIVWQIRRRKNK